MKTLVLLFLYYAAGLSASGSPPDTGNTLQQAQLGAALTAAAYADAQQNASALPAHKHYEYTPSEAVNISTRTEIAHWFDQHLLQEPDVKAELRRHLMETDLIALLQPELESRGYEINSVASAMALWLIVNYTIIHDVEVSDAHAHALHRQLEHLFAGLPDFERGSDAEKQRMAEGLYWTAVLQRHTYEQAKAGMPGYHLEAIANESRRVLQTYGLNLDQLEIGEHGLGVRASQPASQ